MFCKATGPFCSGNPFNRFIKRLIHRDGTVSASFDFLHIDYKDFRDITQGGAAGDEPLYQMDANIIQLFVSFWY